MDTLTITDLEDSFVDTLRRRAAVNGTSVGQEAGAILRDALSTLEQTEKADPVGMPNLEQKAWHLDLTLEEILALGRKPGKPFDQKRAFDELYAYLDEE